MKTIQSSSDSDKWLALFEFSAAKIINVRQWYEDAWESSVNWGPV